MGANNERPFSGAAKGEPVEQKPSFDKRFALLIDADNVSSKYIKPILDELSKYGTITYKRIYGDWTSTLHAKWKDALLDNSITPIQQFSYTVGKNATDSAMIIDAMDILYTNSVEGFCLVSSDSDFTRLASRIRESGLTVIGMGEKKTPTPFRKACDIFTTLELLIGEARRDKANGSSSSLTIEEVERAVVDIITDNQNNGKSTGLGEVGSRLLKRYPDFDVRSFGTNLLSKLLGEFKSVTIRKDGSNVRVELAEGAEHERAAAEKPSDPEGVGEQAGEQAAQVDAAGAPEGADGEAGDDAAAHGSKSRRRRGRRRKSVKAQGADQGESTEAKADEVPRGEQAISAEPAESQVEGSEAAAATDAAAGETVDEEPVAQPEAARGAQPQATAETQPEVVAETQSAEGEEAIERKSSAPKRRKAVGRPRKAKAARAAEASSADAPEESVAASELARESAFAEASEELPAASEQEPDARPKQAAKRRRGRPRKAVVPLATPDDFIRTEVGAAGEGGVAVADLAKRVRTRFKSFKVRELGYPHFAGYLADVEGVRVYKQNRENWVEKE